MKLVRKDLRERNKYRHVERLLVGKSFLPENTSEISDQRKHKS